MQLRLFPPRNPQEINVGIPLSNTLRATSISGERTLQCPPQGLAAWQRQHPHTENCFRSFPAVIPLQGIVNDTRRAPKVSLDRLIPLVDYIGAWQCLPNISPWVLHIRYRLQFSYRPPQFDGVVWTAVHPEQGRVMEQEFHSLLGHRACSSARQGVRVLRPVLHSSQEGWGVASNFGSAALESFSQEIQVQDAHYSYHRESDQIRGLVCHDRSEGRNFHVSIIPSHRKLLRFAFRGRSVPISGSSVWPSSLPSHFHQVHGCSSSATEASGHPCAELYRRLAYTGPVSGDGSSASRCRPWPHPELGVETQHEKERFFCPKAHYWECRVAESRFDRLIPYGLGHGHGRPLCERSVAGPAFLMVHKLSGNASGLQDSEELSPRSQRSPCPNTSRQYVSGLVFEPSGGFEVAPSVQTGAPDPPVIQGETVVSQSDACPQGPESGSRRPVEAGVEARVMETSPRGGEVDMREARPSGSGFVHVSRDDQLSTVVFSHASSPAGVGRHGTDVAEATPVCFFPRSLCSPGVLERVRKEGSIAGSHSLLLVAPFWPARVWFSDIMSLLAGQPWQIPLRRDLLSQAGGTIFHPELWDLWVWPLRGLST